MSLTDFAQQELNAAGLFDKDSDYNGMLGTAVMELMEVFSKQGHSGFSASMVSDIFNTLVQFKPLVPLTGNDSEWVDVAECSGYTLYQNNRCGTVFKEGDNQAYDINGYIFVEPDGASFTSGASRRLVTFPYTPTSTKCYVGFDANPDTDIPRDMTLIDDEERERQRILGRPKCHHVNYADDNRCESIVIEEFQ